MYRVTHNLLSMFGQPEPRAEMVSQALFGDRLDVLETTGDYALVKTCDGYEGWALCGHIAPERAADPLEERVVSNAFAQVYADPERPFSILTTLSMGSRVRIKQAGPDYTSISLARSAFGADTGFVATGALCQTPNTQRQTPNAVLDYAYRLMGTPYLWGGTSAFGIDCSGFVQRVMGMCGIQLPRDAYLQAADTDAVGVRTSDLEFPAPQDIVFFLSREDPRQRGITHVGIALDGETFIHSSGRNGVGVNRFDEECITSEYTYKGGLRV